MHLTRRKFVGLILGTTGALLPSLLVAPAAKKIEFPAGTRWRLYMIHNRYTDDQLARLLAWTDGEKYEFTVGNQAGHLPADRKWTCLGRLCWVVGRDGYYEHHVVPI